MEFTIEQIAKLLKGTVKGNPSLKISRIEKIQEATEGSISFLSNPKYESYIYSTKASAVIVNKSFVAQQSIDATLIEVEDAYLAFTHLLEEYYTILNFQKVGVEEPSYISADSTTGKNIYRGAFSYIGSKCKIGDNVKIYPHTYIGDNVHIGNNTIIHPGSKIYSNTIIGNNCTIHAGVVIGSDGFGFAPQKDGSYKAIPQIGNVIIEDNVSIGSNTTIDCATLGSTLIKEGVKLDNLIQIAHNVEIGKHTVIAAQSGVSGSSTIGNYCVLAGQVGIVGHIHIGNKSIIAAQSGVTKSYPEENNILLGSPSFDRKQFLKSYVIFKNLPEINERLKELEEKILTLRPHDTIE